MKKTKRIFAIILIAFVLFCGVGILNTCFGVDSIVVPSGTEPDITSFKSAAENVWGIVRLILQVAALTAFIFTGVRYMFASAEGKADLKKGLAMVALGSLITFGSTIFVEIVIKVFEDIT